MCEAMDHKTKVLSVQLDPFQSSQIPHILDWLNCFHHQIWPLGYIDISRPIQSGFRKIFPAQLVQKQTENSLNNLFISETRAKGKEKTYKLPLPLLQTELKNNLD